MVSVPSNNKTSDHLDIVSNEENTRQVLRLYTNDLIFDIKPIYYNGQLTNLMMSKKTEFQDVYDEIGVHDNRHDIVFVYPSFTQAAYDTNGFYDYYNKKCDSKCLTVKIPETVNGFQSSSISGAWALKLLGYPHIKDQDIDKNPEILKQFKRVIVLHSEYVTKREFDAITSHPNVIFLYPNSLYAEVKSDYNNNTISLVRGHGYPDKNIRNGFDWKFDSSKNEYNIGCENWHFYKKADYTFLNCYPEYRMLYDVKLIKALQSEEPVNITGTVTDWINHPDQPSALNNLLQDYDINALHIPNWVKIPATMLVKNQIEQSDFFSLVDYLNQKIIVN